jgi:hypothetical protein
MSSFEDAIWTHLVDQHGADRFVYHLPPRPTRTVRPRAVSAGLLLLAAAAAAIVIVLSPSTSPAPAYALTRVADGSYTVSLYDISRGVPALNAKFRQLGIRETVVPVRAGCKAPPFLVASPGSMSQTVTVTNRYIPSGRRGFIAAEKRPNGRIGLAQGTTAQPIPPCLPAKTSHATSAHKQP